MRLSLHDPYLFTLLQSLSNKYTKYHHDRYPSLDIQEQLASAEKQQDELFLSMQYYLKPITFSAHHAVFHPGKIFTPLSLETIIAYAITYHEPHDIVNAFMNHLLEKNKIQNIDLQKPISNGVYHTNVLWIFASNLAFQGNDYPLSRILLKFNQWDSLDVNFKIQTRNDLDGTLQEGVSVLWHILFSQRTPKWVVNDIFNHLTPQQLKSIDLSNHSYINEKIKGFSVLSLLAKRAAQENEFVPLFRIFEQLDENDIQSLDLFSIPFKQNECVFKVLITNPDLQKYILNKLFKSFSLKQWQAFDAFILEEKGQYTAETSAILKIIEDPFWEEMISLNKGAEEILGTQAQLAPGPIIFSTVFPDTAQENQEQAPVDLYNPSRFSHP
jgi:hypothetical protein